MKTFDGTPIATVISAKGIPFNVRLVRQGDAYGLRQCLTHDKAEPMVEFYDARYVFGTEAGEEFGQFVSRYYAKTLTEDGPRRGLMLDGGVADWTLDADAFHVVYALITMWLHRLQD